ncbi:MAG: BACON domain-containing protein, partial [Alistipes sp.]|nr:BACON domain-containing protein [Alistipes sp.]
MEKPTFNHKRIPSFLFAALLGLALIFTGCSDDEETSEIYAYLSAENTSLDFDVAGGGQQYEFYSNLPQWELYVDYYTEVENWVDVFEKRGSGDGRFTVTVEANTDKAFQRQAQVQVISGGKVYAAIDVTQKAAAPYIKLDMHGMDEIYAGNRGVTRTIKLDTNIPYQVQIPGDVDWIVPGATDGGNQELVIAPTDREGERQARVKFVMVGTGNETVNTEILVTQLGNETDIKYAAETTIADVLSTTATNTIIDRNIFVEGYVISDYRTCNFEDNVMILQQGDKALWIEFADEK